MDTATTPPGDPERGPVTLSTGEQVELPLHTEATMTGAVFSASRAEATELLPTGLSPIRVGPRRAAVAFLCVEYDRIGSGEIAPYDEFGVLVPATDGETTDVPLISPFTRGIGGYVWYLPVTTEPARALGEEIWGYPKEVADITITDDGRRRRATVTVDGDRLLSLEVRRPATVNWSVSASSYTVEDGTLLREPLELTGELGAWPVSRHVTYALGDHSRADRLRSLDLGSRALVRFYADAESVIYPGETIGEIRDLRG